MATDCNVPISDLMDLIDSQAGIYGGVNPVHLRRVEQHLNGCPRCKQALASIRDIHRLSDDFFAAEATHIDDSWTARLLDTIPLEVSTGRLVPLQLEAKNTRVYNTEGGLRALIRRTVSDDGILVSRVIFNGDLEAEGAPIAITLRIAVCYGTVVTTAAMQARKRIRDIIAAVTDINLERVDIEVIDVLTDTVTVLSHTGRATVRVNRNGADND